MKSLILEGPNSPFILKELPDPIANPGEAVARVFTCGAGLTIQHCKAGRTPMRFPRIIGHEICAQVVEVGSGVDNLKVDDAVSAYFYIHCGACRYCRTQREPLCENLVGNVGRECDGGYAEYIKLPAHLFLKLPEGIDWRSRPAHVGVAVDALATPYKVLRRARIEAGETVAVFGAGGGLGIHQVMMARWRGARVVGIETKRGKIEAVKAAGADVVVDEPDGNVVEALMDVTNGKGVDVAVDYVSSRTTLEAAVAALAKQGRMVTLGGAGEAFCLDAKQLLAKEIDVLGSRYVTRSDIMETYELMRRAEVWPLVTEIRPMAEAEIVHQKVENGDVIGRAAIAIAEQCPV
ncbi:MAG: alcohol dehydrogenase catalytic domain-containing protein [Hyphomicrobiaceae bacterium]